MGMGGAGGGCLLECVAACGGVGFPVCRPCVGWMVSGCRVPRGGHVTGYCRDELGKDPSFDGGWM